MDQGFEPDGAPASPILNSAGGPDGHSRADASSRTAAHSSAGLVQLPAAAVSLDGAGSMPIQDAIRLPRGCPQAATYLHQQMPTQPHINTLSSSSLDLHCHCSPSCHLL